MPSEKEIHRWMVLAVGLMWGVLVGLLWDQLVGARFGRVEDLFHHGGVRLGVMSFGTLFLTRLVYCALRERQPSGREANGEESLSRLAGMLRHADNGRDA